MRRRTFVQTLALLFLTGCGKNPSQVEQNTPPTVEIVSPAANTFFSGGEQIAIALSATDAQDGDLGGASVSWWVILHHDTHVHPYVQPTSGVSGLAQVSSVGHTDTDIFLRIYARAVDSEGLVDTAFVDVDPRLVSLEIATVPAGLEVTVDGQPRTTPVTIPSVVGMERALGAPSPQSQGGTSYTFSAWSQGGSATQAYVTPAADVALTATFTGGGASNQSPTVSITEPAGGATVIVGASVTVSAQASDPDGTVTTVQFREGSTVIGSDDTAPYSIQWTPGTTGTRSLTARATDDDGATTTSAVVQVTVQSGGGGDVTPPTATITAPVQGTRGLTGSVSLSATASDNVGVTSVEFQVDGETLATDATAPYTATLQSTSAFTTGAHTFRARARDAAGNWSPWSSATVTFGGNVNLPAGFVQEVVASGFTHPASTGILTTAAFAPDGRLFILEQLGRVHVLKNGAILPTPFLELTADPDQERGLLGIAFHPDFPASPYVYLYYTRNGSPAHNRISRFTANGDVAVPGSELVIVDLDPLTGGGFHNGGAMAFGPDGKLYVAVGDNGLQAQSQSLSSRLGKMLRYNPDGTIPTDNPFYSTATGANRAIWAYGLRNPYTFGFHPDTGRMHINDVGNGAWEEINLGVAGGNYGWPATEGPTTNPAYESPILAYAHGDPESPTLFSGASILGSAFYDPPVAPFGAAYVDDYFFADYVSGWIYRMDSDEWDTAYAFARLGGGITNLAVGPDGALYVLWGSAAQGGSRVVRISRP